MADREVDSRLCISYLTIELKGSIPRNLRPKMGKWIFGCDICQEVCPWNGKAPLSMEKGFAAEDSARTPDLGKLMELDQSEFRKRFKNSPVLRTKRRGLLRNVAIALGNWGNPHAIPALELGLLDQEPLIRSHSAWGLGQVATKKAYDILEKTREGRDERLQLLLARGYPAYTTSAGWLGYSDDKLRSLCREAVEAGWTHLKLKVGRDLEDDVRRLKTVREVVGNNITLMVDANQVWEPSEAVEWMKSLAEFDLWFLEEPTSPDDILGHRQVREGIHPIKVATGECCQNRIIFKQFLQADAIDVVQIDATRVGGLNENLAIMLMAAKFGKPICPHAGGVGLCEYVQHLSMIDYLCISGSWEGKVAEYVDHLHEHFVTPCILKDGRYQAPMDPGFSIEMKPDTLARFPAT